MTESSPVERVRDLLEAVAAGLGLDADVEVTERDGEIQGTLHGEELGLLIGRHGQTIDAVQHLAYKIAVRGAGDPRRVVVDAVTSGNPVALDVMSAGERKVVHEYLKDRGDVETYSEGTEPARHLVIAPLRST